jgi:hypothetical protein
LESSVVNSGEIATTGGLVFFGAKSEGVDIDTSVGGTCVCLERLDLVEVGTFTFREAILSVKLKLGDNNGVKTPTMHVNGGFTEDESSSIGDRSAGSIFNSTVLEKTRTTDDGSIIRSRTKGTKRVGKSINGIGVVERLGTEAVEKKRVTAQGRAVVNILIGLDNPNKFLTGVVEVELDLVGRGTNRFITGELELFNEILMRVLRHSATFIGVKEDVINVKRSGNKRAVVGSSGLNTGRGSGIYSPQALVNGAKVEVNLDFVVLKSNEGKGKSGIAAKPELKRNIKSSFRKGITGSTDLSRSVGTTGSIDGSKRRVSDVGKLSGVTNHLEVSTLLFGGKSKLVPDVHPVTVLTVNSLTTNLNLNLGDKLFSGEIEPAGTAARDFRKSNLKIGAVSKITISAYGACDTATEIGLSVESLFDRFHRKVSVTTVSNFPESNLGITGKVNILCAIGY